MSSNRNTFDPNSVEKKLGVTFRRADLLERALTHKSFAHEAREVAAPHNESLEFLGDAVLGFLITDVIYKSFPGMSEGRQSKIKAHLVSTVTLSRLSGQLDLPEHLKLGKGEEKTGGRRKMALRANAFEAVVAAIYLDQGIDAVREVVDRIYAPLLSAIRDGRTEVDDAKTALQEYLQARDRPLATYEVVAETGPEHKKTFHVELYLEGEKLASASGGTKKEAELLAAREALERLIRDSDRG